MKNVSCYIRQNRNLLTIKVFPWVVETYPNGNKQLHRRDFECRNIGECFKICYAVYPFTFVMSYDKAAGRAYRKRWKGIF